MRPRLLSLVAFSLTASAMTVLSPATAGDSPIKPSTPSEMAQPEQTAQPEIIEVVTQGIGNDANSALLNAYSNAVQQALGLYVDAETMVQNDQIVQDKILTYSKGFIQEATTVKQSQANGLFQVNIRAKVKRQQLLEQAKANNITVKAVEGTSLHAQVESQIKQEKDAKMLLKKVLIPLIDTTFHRANIVPSTKEQPNPTIDKDGNDDNFVTLNYKVYFWIDEQEYFKYVKNNLIPVFNKLAIKKEEITAKYRIIDGGIYAGMLEEIIQEESFSNKDQEVLFSVLIWKDKGLTASKWQRFVISKDTVPLEIQEAGHGSYNGKTRGIIDQILCEKAIELNLIDENGETIVLGEKELAPKNCGDGGSESPMAIALGAAEKKIRISPYFTAGSWVSIVKERYIIPQKLITISIKFLREDIPRIKSAKLEIKPARGN